MGSSLTKAHHCNESWINSGGKRAVECLNGQSPPKARLGCADPPVDRKELLQHRGTGHASLQNPANEISIACLVAHCEVKTQRP